MDVAIAVTGEHSADDLRSLRHWLAGDDDLNDGNDTADRTDGGVPDTTPDTPPEEVPHGSITARLDRPGAAAALADSLVGWIREHTHDGVYEVRRPDGVSVRISAARVRQTGGAMVRGLISELCRGGDSPGNAGSTSNGN